MTAILNFLEGYNPVQWPDLAADRIPTPTSYTSAPQTVDFAGNRSIHDDTFNAAVLVTLARIIGSYCGASDVLLALGDGEAPTFVRVHWTDAETWRDVMTKVNQHLHGGTNGVSLRTIRDTLGLTEKQMPCLALCSESKDLANHPLVLSCDQASWTFTITTSNINIHPTVSSNLLSQFTLLFEHGLTHPHTPISSLPVFPPHLSSICGRTSSAYLPLPVRIITDHLTAHSISTPHYPAVRWYPDPIETTTFETITFLELHQAANRLARWLVIEQHLKKEDRVAVCMQRDLSFHVVMMGLLRAGGCYVPIDPELPIERKTFIVKDSNARFLFTSEGLFGGSVASTEFIDIDDPASHAGIQSQSSDDLDESMGPTPDSLAYLLYTSGTTGTPKGCLLTHLGLSEAISALSSLARDVRMDDVKKEGSYLGVASIAFDVHLAETFVPLLLGMPLLCAPRALLFEDLPGRIRELGVTHVGIVPSLIEATMAAAVTDVDEEGQTGMKLRYIASGGEKMSDSILDKWANHPKVRLANFYGPSEVTIGCCARFMDGRTPRANIGKSFWNVGSYVVDSNMAIVPRGGVGELVVEGPLVGKGYYGRDDLTAKSFMEWPEKGMWAYRTGDLVRMMPDDTLEILGRIDTQIKLRGVRIESEGVSAVIRKAVPAPPSNPDFSLDASTILAKHPSIGVEQLISFIAWDTSVPVAKRRTVRPSVITTLPRDLEEMGMIEMIKKECEVELASYMRPSWVVPVTWLPLSGNGKADVKVLGALFEETEVAVLVSLMNGGGRGDGNDSQQSRTLSETEEKVLKVMDRHTPGPMKKEKTDPTRLNIFECGLDSMGIVKFVADLRVAFNVDLHGMSASEVMKASTLEKIATLIESGEQQSPLRPETASSPHQSFVERFSREWLHEVSEAYPGVEMVLPPFCVQEGVLYRSQADGTMYVQHVVLRIETQDVDMKKLQDAWDVIMGRCPMLRTVFFFSRALVQVVLRRDAYVLPWHMNPWPGDVKNTSFSDWFLGHEAPQVSTEINENLSMIPPWRINVYPDNSGSACIVLSIHHSLFDGISLPVLLADVETEYIGSQPTPSAAIVDVIEQIASVDMDRAREYFTTCFKNYKWPKETFRLASRSISKRMTVPFDMPLSSLRALATRQQVTMQALLTGTFANLLAHRLYHSEDVVFGVIRSGRLLPVPHIDNAICPTISVLPVRVNFSCNEDTVLRTIQRDISAVVEFEHVALGKVQNWIRPGEMVFETMFSVSVKHDAHSKIWQVVESEPPKPDYILAMEVVIDPELDSLVVQAAWVPDDTLSSGLVEDLLKGFESTAVEIGEGHGTAIKTTPASVPAVSKSESSFSSEEEEFEDFERLDATLIVRIRDILVKFLTIDESLITETVSFIALGLDSIKSVGLARVLHKEGFNISAVDLMSHSSLRQLAKHIGSIGHAPHDHQHESNDTPFTKLVVTIEKGLDVNTIRLTPGDQIELYPTTILQAGMLSQTCTSRGELYVHAFPLRLKRNVDDKRLYDAWMRAMQLFSILRTSFHFVSGPGIWAQAVHSSCELDWSVEPLENLEEYEEKLGRFLAAMKPSDEADFRRPPIRLRMFRANSSIDSRLVLVMHHALYDGLSVAKLLEAVQEIYHGRQISKWTQFVDLLRQFIAQEQNGTSFWVERLRDFHRVELPKKAELHTPRVSHGTSHVMDVNPALVERTCRNVAVTVQCLGQAALAKLIALMSLSVDVVFGHVVSGRSIPGAEDVIGPVLNTIPCRVRLPKDIQNRELLKSIHTNNVAAMPWQQASLREIQRDLGLPALWDSLFLFQPSESTDSDSEPIWEFEVGEEEEAKVQYPLNIELHQQSSGFLIKAACRSDFLNIEELHATLNRFESLLRQIIEHPDAHVFDDVPELANVILSSEPKDQQNGITSKVGGAGVRGRSAIPSQVHKLLVSVTKVPMKHISPETSLAALGIDSITAVQLAAKSRRNGLRLSAGDVVESRTVGDLITKIDLLSKKKLVNGEAHNISVAAEEKKAILDRLGSRAAGDIEAVSVVSSGMKWLIGAWQRSEGTRFQHAFAYQLPENIDTARLRVAWMALLSRHAILRSTFACVKGGGEPRMVTFEPGAMKETWSEETYDESVFFRCVLAKMKHIVSRPPPTSQPATRAFLLRSCRHCYFLIHLHHFQYDAWSLRLIMDDLSDLYQNVSLSSSSDLASFLHTFAPTSHRLAEQKKYWRDEFPTPYKPTLFPRLLKDLETPDKRQERTVYIDKKAISQASVCKERARSLEISLQAIFLACWSRVQALYTSDNSVTFGLWQAGRTGSIDDIARLAVPCMNVLPFHVSDVNDDLLQVAKRVQDSLRRRTALVEQSDIVRVDEWLGGRGAPLTNVFINMVKIAPDIQERRDLFEPVDAPYFIPDIPPPQLHSTIDPDLPITAMIQDDVMIDIIILEHKDTVLVSIDAAAEFMGMDEAKEMVDRWITAVEAVVGSSCRSKIDY